jgi:hypothetical protein
VTRVDEERWARIEGFDNYAVSTHGRVMNVRYEHILSPRYNSYGHPRVALMRDGQRFERYVSHLVAAAFMENYRPGVHLRYVDEDPGNCHAMNIKMSRGRTLGRFQVPTEDPKIRRLAIIETGQTFRNVAACANFLSTNPSNIYRVLRGERSNYGGFTFEYVMM